MVLRVAVNESCSFAVVIWQDIGREALERSPRQHSSNRIGPALAMDRGCQLRQFTHTDAAYHFLEWADHYEL